MKLRKMNKTPWLQLGLAAVLMVGCLVMAVGPAQARYRVNNKANVYFEAQAFEGIYLGQMVKTPDGEGTYFDDTVQGNWKSVDGQIYLDFAVANGKTTIKTDESTGSTVTKQVFAKEDQRVYIRLLGDLSIYDGEGDFGLKLVVPPLTDTDEPKEYVAQIKPIDMGSSIYKTFGPGWVFTFVDQEGEELYWTLEGRQLSAVELKLVMVGDSPTNAAQLKLQVTGEYVR